MIFRSLHPTRPAAALTAGAAALALVAMVGFPAAAALDDDPPTTVTTGTDADEGGLDLPVSIKLGITEAIGLGTFVSVSEEQRQSFVATVFAPSIAWPFATDMSLAAGISGTWYHALDFGTTLPDGQFLWGDLSLKVAHGKVWSDEDLGLTLNASFTALLPTSLASRFQTRVMRIRPGVGLSWKKGPVSLTGGFSFTKAFTRKNVPTIDCDDFEDPAECRQGRASGPGVGGGFTSESRGGEVFLPSSGVTSFWLAYSLGASWEIIDGLSLDGGLQVVQSFGINSLPVDDFSSPNARTGRSQTDRLLASLGLSYQIIKQLGASVSINQDTIRPFGTDGGRLVVFDRWFKRAPDNLTTFEIALTGSL